MLFERHFLKLVAFVWSVAFAIVLVLMAFHAPDLIRILIKG